MATGARETSVPEPREEGGGGLNPSSKEVGKKGIGRKSGNGLNSYPKPLVAQRAGGITVISNLTGLSLTGFKNT